MFLYFLEKNESLKENVVFILLNISLENSHSSLFAFSYYLFKYNVFPFNVFKFSKYRNYREKFNKTHQMIILGHLFCCIHFIWVLIQKHLQGSTNNTLAEISFKLRYFCSWLQPLNYQVICFSFILPLNDMLPGNFIFNTLLWSF